MEGSRTTEGAVATAARKEVSCVLCLVSCCCSSCCPSCCHSSPPDDSNTTDHYWNDTIPSPPFTPVNANFHEQPKRPTLVTTDLVPKASPQNQNIEDPRLAHRDSDTAQPLLSNTPRNSSGCIGHQITRRRQTQLRSAHPIPSRKTSSRITPTTQSPWAPPSLAQWPRSLAAKKCAC